MGEKPQDTKVQDTHAEQAALKRKLVTRIGFAGAMIVALLGALAFVDYLSSPEEPAPAPAFTEPVPVANKEVTQPVKPAEPAAVDKTPATAAPENSAAPVDKSIPPASPQVAAQPALLRNAERSEKAERADKEKPAAPAAITRPTQAPPHGVAASSASASRSDESRPGKETPGAASAPAQPPRAEEPAPARLLPGYALQAGVFADVRRAEELHARLTLNGIPSSLEIRVQVGPFRSRAEADAAREKMKALGVDAVLLPPKTAAR